MCIRDRPVDDRFQVLVAQGQVTPGFHVETGGIDMYVKPAAPVHLPVTQVEHPADLLPVSYTHLDVYKRQIESRIALRQGHTLFIFRRTEVK